MVPSVGGADKLFLEAVAFFHGSQYNENANVTS